MHRRRILAGGVAAMLGAGLLPRIALTADVTLPVAPETATVAPALTLPKSWNPSFDPAPYLVSEKLDGVRAYWDGKVLRFRSGRPLTAPPWFVAGLPNTPLDGELWIARGQFDRVSGIVRRIVPVDVEWRELRFMVFDLPGAPGVFAERAQHIVQIVKAANQPWLKAVAQQRVPDAAALRALLARVVAQGGEGLILHRADALWLPGRSDAVLKLKPMADEEARVVGHLPGKGRHQGRLGALLLELPDGQRFALGTGFTDAQREAPPAVGALVTYRYRDRTPKGLPRFASFVRVREAE